MPPTVGYLWTPPYWGWGGSAFIFHEGYWGPHVGFYGGVNYGFGYGGVGFIGGRWVGGHFAYNTAVVNVNRTIIHNTYEDRTVINRTVVGNRVSYNGGAGGLQARPTAQEAAFGRENHVGPTSEQANHFAAARADRGNLASVNGGRPQMAAARTTSEYHNAATPRGGLGGSQGAQHAVAQRTTGQQNFHTNTAQPQASHSNFSTAENRSSSVNSGAGASHAQPQQHVQAQSHAMAGGEAHGHH